MSKIFICFVALIINSNLFAQTNPSNLSFTLDSRYFSYGDQQYDIRGLPQFGYEVTLLRGKLLETMTEKTFMGKTSFRRKVLFFTTELLGLYYMDLSFGTAYHELGHASRVAAIGYGYSFDGGAKSFFPYYFHKFGKNGGHTMSGKKNFSVYQESRFVTSSNTFTPYTEILISTAGINSATAYSGYLAKKAQEDGAHVSHFMSYVFNKLTPSLYPEKTETGVRFGDIANILDAYRKQGVGNFNEKDIKDMNFVSFFASASTWNYFQAVSNYFSTGQMRSHLKKRKVNLPNFESYYTSKGISMKALTSYELNESVSMPISVEHVFRGKHITEYSLGASYLLESKTPSRLTASVLMGLSPGGKFEYQIDPAIDSRLNFGVNIDNLNSLDGERNIVSLKNGNVYPSFYLKGTKYF
jgi:hypothetical protein